jgi:hypothetical protein
MAPYSPEGYGRFIFLCCVAPPTTTPPCAAGSGGVEALEGCMGEGKSAGASWSGSFYLSLAIAIPGCGNDGVAYPRLISLFRIATIPSLCL